MTPFEKATKGHVRRVVRMKDRYDILCYEQIFDGPLSINKQRALGWLEMAVRMGL